MFHLFFLFNEGLSHAAVLDSWSRQSRASLIPLAKDESQCPVPGMGATLY